MIWTHLIEQMPDMKSQHNYQPMYQTNPFPQLDQFLSDNLESFKQALYDQMLAHQKIKAQSVTSQSNPTLTL